MYIESLSYINVAQLGVLNVATYFRSTFMPHFLLLSLLSTVTCVLNVPNS